jgi:hypothetical protein
MVLSLSVYFFFTFAFCLGFGFLRLFYLLYLILTSVAGYSTCTGTYVQVCVPTHRTRSHKPSYLIRATGVWFNRAITTIVLNQKQPTIL